MKRFVSLIMALCLLLSGCGMFEQRLKEPVTFYYLRAEYEYFTSDGIIVSEEREASGHRDELSYLLALYLIGPTSEELVSPLPKGTRIYTAAQQEDTIQLQLSDTTATMDDTEFAIACACLSLTCLGMTDAVSVTINSGERTVTMTRDTLILNDNTTANIMEDTK